MIFNLPARFKRIYTTLGQREKDARTRGGIDALMADNIKIQNVVVSCDTHARFVLEAIVNQLPGAEYAPESFPGLVYHVANPKASTLVFSTGKVICAGTQSLEKAKQAIKKTLSDFNRIGVEMPKKLDMEIVNIVANAKIAKKLELNKIVFGLENCEYEPEQFPGVVHRLGDPKVVFLIFSSGSVVCTGGRSVEAVELGVKRLKRKLKQIGAM